MSSPFGRKTGWREATPPDLRSRGYGAPREGRRSLLLLPMLVLLGAPLVWSWLSRVPSGPEDVRTVFVPVPPPALTVADTLRRGQTLGEVFGTYGLDGLEIVRLVDAIREYESPRRLRPGTVFHFAMRPAERPARISLELDADRRLHLVPTDDGDAWTARLDSVPVAVDTILVGGVVRTNLYEADLWGDAEALDRRSVTDLVFRLSEVYAWQVDFYRDIRRGDEFRTAVEREVRPDGSLRALRILAASFRNRGKEITAIRFHPREGERVEYYDRDGEALRSQFLRSPLQFGRVTSGFSYRRYHPVLRRRRPHLGTDYGAPVGTPVRATGSGTVTRAGWWGGYGRVVEVRHQNGLRTRYAHMSRIGGGIRPGARVDQGQTIGYVGSSGLSTAPHLHYEFLKNGTQVNPSRLDLPNAEPVAERDLERFRSERDAALLLLDGLWRSQGRFAGGRGTIAVGETDGDI